MSESKDKKHTSAFVPSKALAIVLGASEWPCYPEFKPSAAFGDSARAFGSYLTDINGLNLPIDNVCFLIDEADEASKILRRMRQFVRQRKMELKTQGISVTDLIIYYVGHGGFGKGDAFFLSVRSTEDDDPLATSISADSLGRFIRDDAAGIRSYLILDCCFAASVTKVFMNAGPIGVAEIKLQEALPPQGDPAGDQGDSPEYGVALLCASGARDPARAPMGQPYTMFSGGLLEVLKEGELSRPRLLSLDDLCRTIREKLIERFDDEAVLPQIHSPIQRKGRVDLFPIFRNAFRIYDHATSTKQVDVKMEYLKLATFNSEAKEIKSLTRGLPGAADNFENYAKLPTAKQSKLYLYFRNTFLTLLVAGPIFFVLLNSEILFSRKYITAEIEPTTPKTSEYMSVHNHFPAQTKVPPNSPGQEPDFESPVRYYLADTEKLKIDALIKKLKKTELDVILVYGQVDSRESRYPGWKSLAVKRAETVKKRLIENGINSSTIICEPGDTQLNTAEDRQAEFRRADIEAVGTIKDPETKKFSLSEKIYFSDHF